jgi:hypothetical protein
LLSPCDNTCISLCQSFHFLLSRVGRYAALFYTALKGIVRHASRQAVLTKYDTVFVDGNVT